MLKRHHAEHIEKQNADFSEQSAKLSASAFGGDGDGGAGGKKKKRTASNVSKVREMRYMA